LEVNNPGKQFLRTGIFFIPSPEHQTKQITCMAWEFCHAILELYGICSIILENAIDQVIHRRFDTTIPTIAQPL